MLNVNATEKAAYLCLMYCKYSLKCKIFNFKPIMAESLTDLIYRLIPKDMCSCQVLSNDREF